MKPNWFLVVSFKTELLSEYLIHKGYREDLKKLLPKVGLLRNRMIIDNDIYIDLNEVDKIQEVLSEDIIKYGTEAYEAIEEQSKVLLTVAKNASKIDQHTSNRELADKLETFFKEYQKSLGAIGIPTIIDLTLEITIKEFLKISGVDNIEEAFSQLAVSYKPVATNQEREDLIEIAIKKNNSENSADVGKLVKAHAEKYGWLHSTLFLGDEYTPEKVFEELSLMTDPAEEKERRQIERTKQLDAAKQIVSKIISQEGREVAKFLQKAVYFRTARLEWMNHACFIVRPLMNEVANRIQLDFSDLIYLYPHQILGALSDSSSVKADVVREHQKGYAFVSDDLQEYSLFIGGQLEEWKNKFSTKSTSDFVKGLVARKGKVRGNVVLIKDRSELNKVRSGDVIVTPLTTPDFIVAMKKASAIITDLGGMTSHAAIVSRELGIPCIVGTKNATKILRDGDMVEVDADRGVVTKI